MNTSFIDNPLSSEGHFIQLEFTVLTEQGEQRVDRCKRKLEQAESHQPTKKAKHEDPQGHNSLEFQDVEDESEPSFSCQSDESIEQDDDEICESPLLQSSVGMCCRSHILTSRRCGPLPRRGYTETGAGPFGRSSCEPYPHWLSVGCPWENDFRIQR